ncbi:hypothetical protein JZ751_006376 [Albula glossodonta]|uniref:Uncharacterized protein n=1 Tax=Albula glossodonta TaxID=121402 RepID=A0A8T2N4Q2_9TELE|nr:hypothetical protein JZ751_006376 [Albula glossodonta]
MQCWPGARPETPNHNEVKDIGPRRSANDELRTRGKFLSNDRVGDAQRLRCCWKRGIRKKRTSAKALAPQCLKVLIQIKCHFGWVWHNRLAVGPNASESLSVNYTENIHFPFCSAAVT